MPDETGVDLQGGLPPDPVRAITRAVRKQTTRRRFMGVAGAYLAGAMSIDALLSACGASPSGTKAASTSRTGGIRVLNFFTTETDPPTQANLMATINAFEAQFPDAHISPIFISGNERDERARTGLAVGQDLGMFEIDRSYSPTFVDAGYLHPLDSVINKIGGDEFAVGTRQVINGHDWVFPYGGGPFCCWYRTDEGSQPNTIEDLKARAKANTGGGKYGIALASGAATAVENTLPQFIWSNGGDYYDPKGNTVFGSDAVTGALQNVVDLLKYAPPGNSNWSVFEYITVYLNGLVSMAPWAGRLGENMYEQKSPQESKSSVVRPPWGPQRIGLTRWSTVAIDKRTQYPDLALQFMEYLYTGKSGVAYAGSVPGQLIPAIKTVRDAAAADTSNPFIKAHPDWLKTLYDQAPNGTDYGGPMGAVASGTLKLYNGPGAPWSQTAWGANSVDWQLLQKIALQNVSVKDAQKFAVDQFKAIAKDYRNKHPKWRPYNG
ncbi:MAG: ABC transporter substrate-binding protein [Candidatus Dormibacteraceae bacterium]